MENKKKFQKDLVHWFEQNKRILPWRNDKDPYKIWISEVMLQQTKVDTVIPYFHRFTEAFPTIEDLANAAEEEVLKQWEGLGYYSRARNLHAGAKQIVKEYNGKFPSNTAIENIKGIGPYTKGAILSIAFGKPEPAVDGNVMRVYARLFLVWDDVMKQATRKKIETLVRETIDKHHTSSFNQGIMEIGALICTPTKPKCEDCPLQSHCEAYKITAQHELPVKSKKKPPTPVQLGVALLFDQQGRLVVEKRNPNGLLGNLWQFPIAEINAENGEEFEKEMKKKYGPTAQIKSEFMKLTHIFSHIKWEMTVYIGEIAAEVSPSESLKQLQISDINLLPLPVAFQKINKEVEYYVIQREKSDDNKCCE